MTIIELIKALIIRLYDKEFIGEIEYINNGNYYKVSLYLNPSNRPLIISGEFSNINYFMVYLENELRKRQLHTAVRLTAYPIDNEENE